MTCRPALPEPPVKTMRFPVPAIVVVCIVVGQLLGMGEYGGVGGEVKVEGKVSPGIWEFV